MQVDERLAGCQLLAGRVALVTGAARGLGAAITSAFCQAGARGAALDRDAPFPVLPENWMSIQVDVTDEKALHEAVADVASQLGPLEIVIANAGIVPTWSGPEHIDSTQWDAVFAVNTRSVMATVRESIKRFASGGGSIVAMASLNGWKGDPNIPAYVASKHAVVGFVRSMALALGPRGIRVNALAPGPVATPALLGRMAGRAVETNQSIAEALQVAASATALGRVVEASEVARAALFLASDWSSGITGQVLPVDAGVL